MNSCPAGADSDKLIDKLHAELPVDLAVASTRLRHRGQARGCGDPGGGQVSAWICPPISAAVACTLGWRCAML